MTAWLENPLTEKYYRLKSKLSSPDIVEIPWHWTAATAGTDYSGFKSYLTNDEIFGIHGHVLWGRNDGKSEGIPCSPIANLTYDIIKEVLECNNISLNNLYRASLNLTLPQGNRLPTPHVDHYFEHNVLILYLISDRDSGNTVVCKERCFYKEEEQPNEGTMRSRIISFDEITPMIEFVPIEDSVVMFDGLHYHYTARASKARIALVATYD